MIKFSRYFFNTEIKADNPRKSISEMAAACRSVKILSDSGEDKV